MKLRCPICHSSNSLDAYTEDIAAREFLTLFVQNRPLFVPLVAYLGLFRSASRDLAWSRTLRLTQEVLALDADPRILAAALGETVEALRKKRDRGDKRPLKDHEYLKSVLASVAATGALPPAEPGGLIENRRPEHDDALADWAGTDQLRREIAAGLVLLLARRLGNCPPAATVARTASLWLHELGKAGVLPHEAARVRSAFSGLLSHVRDWWPGPEKLTDELPRRRDAEKLPEPPADPGKVMAAKAKFDEMFDRVIGGVSVPEGGKIEEARRRDLREQARRLAEKEGS